MNVVEHTISTDDEEGVLSTYVPSDSPTPTEAGGTTTPPPSKIRKYAVPISMTLLALSAVVFAAVVWAPGGPGRPNSSIQANLATNTRGTDTESEPTASVNDTYAPTYFPTYVPTYVPTVGNETEEIEEETTNTNTTTDVPSPKPTLPPLDLSWLSPTPPPMEEESSSSSLVPTSFAPTVAAITTTTSSSGPTYAPTIEVSGQNTVTVSTETTGPPTAGDRPPVRK